MHFVQADYSYPINEPRLTRDISEADVVINLAATCNPSQYNKNPVQVIRSNFVDAYKLVDLCAEQKKWLVHFSTSEVYGRTLSSYLRKDNYLDPSLFELDEENTPLIMGPVNRQRWTYACAKQLLERYIVAHHTENMLDFTIVRPLNFFGPRMDFMPGIDGEGVPRVLARFMEALLKGRPLKLVNGGLARRTIMAIEDGIEAVLAILTRPEVSRGQIFNIGNRDNEVTIAELANHMRRLFAQISGRPTDSLPQIIEVTGESFYGPGYEDCDRRMPKVNKAYSLLGWKPKIRLEEILRRSIAYYAEEYGSELE
jgi:UDP-apiose/xylose synthase